jgi:putative sigma-54 modulation protein
MKVHTESVAFKADQKLLDFIEEKVQKMEKYFDRIIEARVHLKLENSGQIKDKIAELRLSVPGEILVAKDSAKTFESSIDGATDAMRRQLLKYKERLR